MIEFWVAGHPITDHRPRVTRAGSHTHMPSEYMTWREAIGWTAMSLGEAIRMGECLVSIQAFSSSWKLQNTDNYLKGVLDALEEILYQDDRQVRGVAATKHPPHPERGEGVLIRVEFIHVGEQALIRGEFCYDDTDND